MTSFLFYLFLTLFNKLAYSQDIDCLRAQNDKSCYGECGNFIDKNKNGICDIWEKWHKKKNKKIKKDIKENNLEIQQRFEDTNNKVNISTYSTNSNKQGNKDKLKEKIKKFNIHYFLFTFIILILISELTKNKKEIYLIYHKQIWNWILFLSFFLTAVSGILLYFDIMSNSKNLLFKIHLIAGFISFISGTYHFIERIYCMYPFNKITRNN